MAEINLLDKYPRSIRPIEERGTRKLARGGRLQPRADVLDTEDILIEQQLLQIARRFGREYFDGDRLYGYGGYEYHPRFWAETVVRFRDYYRLSGKASILDVGCAKGFMLHDFKTLLPDSHVAGIDISQYAYDNAIDDMQPFMQVGSAAKLPYPDKSFDLVVSVNTVDHLPPDGCKKALAEIQRVSRGNSFVCVNAWRTAEERDLLLKWNITALTCMSVDDWKKLFAEVGYQGDYWWFIAQ